MTDGAVYSPQCRDPHLEEQIASLGSVSANNTALKGVQMITRKFLLIGGVGAGIGNFLVFFPAAYYFAVLTGRIIVLIDDSLIGEMCLVLNCGFPTLSEMSLAFPDSFPNYLKEPVRSAKVLNFHQHIGSEVVIEDTMVRADGYMYKSGWYLGRNFTGSCIAILTGCGEEDVSCHDSHALQSLVKGPFKDPFVKKESDRIIGVPKVIIERILNLSHHSVPRLNASVHLRCQFKHFEQLIGPEDGDRWIEAQTELHGWLDSKDADKGNQLFKVMSDKIVTQIPSLKMKEGRRKLVNESKYGNGTLENETTEDISHHIYFYLASDNEIVKEAFALYLTNKYMNIKVIRVKNNGVIVHAKNIGYLKQAGNNTGSFDLALDWYALSLSNLVFAWRRDTDFLSTFAQSARRINGHIDPGSHNYSSNSKGFQLTGFHRGEGKWRTF
jgi:hypothetical protein